MMGPIHSDIFFQDQVLLISVIFSIKLNQGKNSFCLISSAAPPSFKVVIKEAILFIRRVKLASSIILDHAAAPKYSSVKYQIHRIDCKVWSVPWGFSSFTLTTLGLIPKWNMLVLVDTAAYNGTYKTNLLNFQHYNLTQRGVYIDGEQIAWINPCSWILTVLRH